MKTCMTVAAFVVCAAMIALAVFLPTGPYVDAEKKPIAVLTLWNVDAFEGGRGSRASYLRSVAADFEAENGCIITVISETVDDALKKMGEGALPDIISFSHGTEAVLGACVRLDGINDNFGGDYNGATFAAAWARGSYAVINKKGEKPERMILSKGAYTFPEIACVIGGVDMGGAVSLPPEKAFNEFLKGNATLIGTQRDVYRLKNDIENYDIRPIGGFSDLIQYVSVTAEDEALATIGKKFVSYLVTKGQNGVNTLGLIAVASEANIGDNGLIDCFFDVECAYTLSPFTSKNVVENALDKYNASPKSEQDRAQFIKSVTKRLK